LAILSANSISKSYDGHQVLFDINLQIDKGEILAIIGRSGSGKSTLIRCLAGLIDIDGGTILFNNEELEGPKKRLVPGYEEIRLVHQDFQLKHKMSVRENIRYELLAYNNEYQDERIEDLLSLCKIKHLESRDIAEVSGGEKQRVAIARAMATEPDVLLLDEPFSNLDLNTKFTLLEELKVIASSTDTAIILITHDAHDAMEIADRVMVMKQGKVIREGDPESVYFDPTKKAVAELIGLYNKITSEEASNFISISDETAQFGIWAEDVVIGERKYIGEIKKTTFGGPYHKILIDFEGILFWAFDFSRRLNKGDSVYFDIKTDRIFRLES